MENKKEVMLDIWFFVGLILIIYGLILTIIGVYFIFKPYEKTVLYEYNPDLWWGLIMVSAGIILYIISLRSRRLTSNANSEKQN